MNTIKRTSRESETKVSNEAKKTWTPPSSLDAPPAPNGYAHRWIRTTVQGFEDTANVSKKLREGWDFVRVEQVEKEIGTNKYLARIPEEILVARAEYFAKLTQDRMNAVDNDLMKEQHPDMPINIDRQSRVTFGGSRKK